MAAILGLQVLPWPSVAVILPAASPWVALGSALAARHVSWVSWLALPLVLLALVKGRWFCRRLCPVGLVLDVLGNLNRRNRDAYHQVPALGRWLVVFGAGTAAAGYAWFLWMDPLALFNGFAGVWRPMPRSWGDVLPAIGFGCVLLLTIYRPHIWCERLCPLGALQAMLGGAGRRIRALLRSSSKVLPGGGQDWMARSDTQVEPWRSIKSGRRIFLMALCGGAAGWLTRRLRTRNSVQPLRPPGVVDESRFPGLCVRCGNCIQVCPERILVPDLGGSGLGGLLTPVVNYGRDYCDEWCNRCTQVCPTGAIRRLTLEEKRCLSLGNARIDRSRCLAWSQQQYCLLCAEFCPYLAIRSLENQGVPCPEVNQAVCRGCGACQSQCPARPRKAIVVWGMVQHPAE